MLVGDPESFAIEFEIAASYEDPSLRGIGFFVIYIGGTQYGRRASDATLLANSHDAVTRLIANRGTHRPPFSAHEEAWRIADAVGRAIYADEDDPEYLGLSRGQLNERVHSSGVIWAPDGDEAFDDGSYVLVFDVGDRVRLVGFRRRSDQRHDPGTLREAWLESERFYGMLQEWADAFSATWNAMPKAEVSPDEETRDPDPE